MSVIISDLKQLIKKEKTFLLQLVFVQAVSIFGVLFVAGALMNNYMVDRETPYGTLVFSVEFDNEVEFGDIRDDVNGLFDKKYHKLIKSADIGIRENKDGEPVFLYTVYSYKNGKYYVGNEEDNNEYDLISGHFFTEEEFNSDIPLVLTAGYDSEVYLRNGTEYKIIGKKNHVDNDSIRVFCQPNMLSGEKIRSIAFETNRILTSREKKNIKKILEKATGGPVELIIQEDVTNEKKAVFNSILISGGLIIFSLVGTLIILFIYMLSKRRKRLAIWRLVGCSRIKTSITFMIELFIIAELSLLSGLVVFYLCRFAILDSVYKYMRFVLTKENVAVVFGILSGFIFLVCFSLALAAQRITIKELLSEGEK